MRKSVLFYKLFTELSLYYHPIRIDIGIKGYNKIKGFM